MELFSSWTGSEFLLFYMMMLVFAGLAAWWMPTRLRSRGRRSVPDDHESIALLGGGPARFADSILADLYARGALVEGAKGELAVTERSAATSPAAQALLATGAPVTFQAASQALVLHADRLAARLQRAGLLLHPEERTRLRWLSIAPFAVLLMIGLYRQRAGSALGEPTEYLIILMVLTVVLAIIRFARFDPRTAAGIALVKDLRQRNSRLARAPRAEEAALAVALFGTGVLVGTPWEPVHAMRQQGGDGGDGVEGGSDGGSGDGGGGCGGCGG